MFKSRFPGLMSLLLLIKIILIANMPKVTESVAVISIDLGSEFMKIGIVKPGVPMEIVLNKESRRKTPLAVSLRNSEREFGNLALSQSVKRPKTAYLEIITILAKSLDSPAVKAYREKYPFYDIKENPETKTVYFQHDEKTTYSPEDLLAMILDHARDLAADYGEQSIDAAVITVPPYFNQAERKSVLAAAELINLRVLQLINTNTAAGLNYGVFRRKDFNTTGTTLMFFDMGAQGTTATVATYHLIKHKDDYESNPQLVIRGVGFDQSLGGNAFVMRLAKHFAKDFQKKTKKDVFANPKATIKIYKEAERIKNILSANVEHVAQIEGLMDDVDFKLKVTRKEFEEMCADLFERVKNPVNDAMKLAEMIDEEIGAVILVGGSTRIPKVQDELMKASKKKELGKNLNTDEAPALGAVYQAAFASKGYKVLKFYIKDMNLYPIVVDFQKHQDPETETKEKSYIRRTLFDKTNQFPQKKVMTFNKHTSDFDFKVNYGDLSYLSEESVQRFGSLNISHVEVTNLPSIFSKHENEESKGIKVHFKIDDNGILNLEKIDITFEKDGPEAEAEEGTLSKLGNKISSFFGGSEDENQEKENKEESAETTKKEEDTLKTNTTLNTTNSSNATLPKNVTTTLREEISFTRVNLDYKQLTSGQVTEIKNKLEVIKEKERELKKKAMAVNALESYLFDTKDKLYQDEFIACSTEAERETISAKCTQVTDWLDEADVNVETKEYQDQLKGLKKACKDVNYRLNEKKIRPKKLQELKDTMNKSIEFLATIANLTGGEDKPLTQTQYDSLEKLIETTKEWEAKMIEEQSKTPDNETPKLLSTDITDKIESLKREVGYLVTKIKYFRPPTKKTPLKTDEKTKTANKTEETVPNSDESRTEESKTEESKTDESKADESKTDESTSDETKSDDSEEKTTVKSETTDNPEL